MKIGAGEHLDNGHIYAMVRMEEGDWGVYGFIPDFLAATPGVLAEWRRFNRSVIEHYLRCNDIEFDVIDHGNFSEGYDPIKFTDDDAEEGG